MRLTSQHLTILTQNSLKQFEIAKTLLLTLILQLFFISSNAQHRCGTTSHNPEVFEKWISGRIALKLKQQQKATDHTYEVYEIPVVVHIIEPAIGESLGVSDDQVFRQIEILNDDFRRTNEDAVNTPSVFLPVAADTEIQFSLANVDPEGNPTTGINRIVGPENGYTPVIVNDLILLRESSFWSPSHYLNIFVSKFNGYLGFASFPVSDLQGISNDQSDFIFDGILIDYQYFGENSDAPAFESYGRTATHEIGHYLGLRHIWGDGFNCSTDDFVDDTPLANSDNDGLGAPCTFPNPEDDSICATDEMFQNYMDYTNDLCMNLFTQGQKTRMRTVMENSPRRISLLSSPAIAPPSTLTNDLAIKQIINPGQSECELEISPIIEVINQGSNTITSYTIQALLNGEMIEEVTKNAEISTSQSETVFFSIIDITTIPSQLDFNITSVNGSPDNNSQNNNSTITISHNTSLIIPFTENFESTNEMIGEFTGSHPWKVANAPNEFENNQALQFEGFENTSGFGEHAIIKTPILNFSGRTSADLIFSYAYAQVPNKFQDGFTIKVSTDCGQSFPNTIFRAYGSSLSTASDTESFFTPTDQTEWQTDTINITSIAANTDGVQIAFISNSGENNNLYLDNVSVLQLERDAYDVGIVSIEGPSNTCEESTTVRAQLLNVGYENINTISYSYSFNGQSFTQTEDNLLIESGNSLTISFDLDLSKGDENEFIVTIDKVNGSSDENALNNSRSLTIRQDPFSDSFPLIEDFEGTNSWTKNPQNGVSIWKDTVVNTNSVLLANAFEQSQIGAEDWFISPQLDMGTLDSAKLSFKVSYASREGFNDQLSVLMSQDCGNSYNTILNAFSDSLAITESFNYWAPADESDWKTLQVDLPGSFSNEIKLAFVFTNGNGNNLYIDDINIILTVPKVIIPFVIYPNPVETYFNMAFNLNERDDLIIQIVDISGKLILEESFTNVLDQIYDFDVRSLDGLYFVKAIGNKINHTETVYIRR